jgi:hypothetical protein
MPDGDHPDGDRVGVRLERLASVQTAGSILMMAFIAFLVFWNLPAGKPSQDLSPMVSPVVRALGMEQYWQVFAPSPREQTVKLSAHISFADGRTKVVAPPHNGIFVSPYRNYRWQKLVEHLCFDSNQDLLASVSAWFARQEGPGVRTVALACATQWVEPPGTTGPQPPWQVQYPYTLTVSSSSAVVRP